MIILVFEIGDNPPTTGSKTQQEARGEKISTTDNTDDGGCGNRIEHGSFSSRLLKLFLNHLIYAILLFTTVDRRCFPAL
jgi:hypothetical protein